MGDWSYQNTDGLGLLEYLHWLEDLDVDGIMGVYAGYSLQGIAVNEGSAFDWVVQEALDQIDFVLGDAATSPMAKLRADLGHPEPFTRVKYIEIGNEDFFAEERFVFEARAPLCEVHRLTDRFRSSSPIATRPTAGLGSRRPSRRSTPTCR
jgi:alpha-N-arabinofuranosidase